MRKFISYVLAATLVLSVSATTYAGDNVITSAGGSGTSAIDITAEATMFSVTVPTTIALAMDSEGNVVVPSANVTAIINNSYGPVKVTAVTANGIDPDSEGPLKAWSITSFNPSEIAKMPVDSNKVAFRITPYKAPNTSSDVSGSAVAGTTIETDEEGSSVGMDVNNTTEWLMEGTAGTNKVIQMKFDAVMTSVSSRLANGHIADIVFTIGWDNAGI